MSCYYHEGRESVSKCAKCGVQLCKECEENALFRGDNGNGQALCLRCSKVTAEEIIASKEKWLRRSLFVLVIAGYFILSAIFSYLDNDVNGNMYLFLGFALAALVIKLIGHGTSPGSVESQVFNGTMAANNPLIYYGVNIVMATIFAPFVYCCYIFGYVKTRKELKQDRINLEMVNTAIAEHTTINH